MKNSWIIFILAAAFFIFENDHFGWNPKPHSDLELLADGLDILIIALGFNARASESPREK